MISRRGLDVSQMNTKRLIGDMMHGTNAQLEEITPAAAKKAKAEKLRSEIILALNRPLNEIEQAALPLVQPDATCLDPNHIHKGSPEWYKLLVCHLSY